MIKLTRLPNPTGALFHNTYKVSGTLTYQEVSAFEIGLRDCFGQDSESVKALMLTTVEDASPTDLTDDDIRALQAERDDLKRKYENVSLYAEQMDEELGAQKEAARLFEVQANLERQACLNANQEWATEQRKHVETQKELDRVTGALHLEQKAHDETKQTLGRSAMKCGDLIRAVREYADKHAKFGTACHEGHVIAEDLFEILRTTVLDNE